MYQPVLPQYFVDPIQSTKQAIDVKNALIAQQDQAESRKGFEEAYRAKMDPQSTWQAPVDASYSYTQGNAAANELFNQQQQQFVNQNIMPALKYAAETGDNKPFEYLQGKMDSFKAQPFAGQGVKLLESLQGISFNKPGEVDGVTLTPETMQILKSNDPAINQLLQNMAGQKVNLKLQNGMVTNVITPKTTAPKTRQRYDEKGNIVYEQWDPESQSWVGQEMGKKPMSGGGVAASEGAVDAYVKAVAEGRMLLNEVPAFRGTRDRVMGKLKTTAPDLNFNALKSRVMANRKSESFIQGAVDASESYITNMSNQLVNLREVINKHALDNKLDNNKVMNMGVRALQQGLLGDAGIAAYDMYVSSLETEAAKLAAGGAQSVAQVAEGNRQKWEKIHNKNMPISEMLKLLDETVNEGRARVRSYESQLNKIQKRGEEYRPTTKAGEKQKDDIRVGGFYKNKKILRTGRDDKGNTYVQLEGIKDPVRVR